LLYINDLPSCTLLKSFLFADFTTLLNSNSDIANLIETVNVEFKKVTDYFSSHKLALHPDKTKFIIFSHNRDVMANPPNIIINLNNTNEDNPGKIFPMTCVNTSTVWGRVSLPRYLSPSI
jgi:hypothetical protein